MNRVGRFFNDNYMVCHIGEWHSHQSLSLNKPSTGDQQTIRCKFPQGIAKFLVIIANIRNKDTIALSPYFFTDEGTRYEKGEYVVLDSEGPFSKDVKIEPEIQLGAEGAKDQQNGTTLEKIASQNGDFSYNARSRQNMGSNFQQGGIASSTYVHASQSSTTSRPDLNSLSQVDPPIPA